MVITVTCPSCSSSFPVDSAKIPEGGVNARCTQCADIFRIDKPAEAEPEALLDLPEVVPASAPPAASPPAADPFEQRAPPAASPPAADPFEQPAPPAASPPAADPFEQPAPFESSTPEPSLPPEPPPLPEPAPAPEPAATDSPAASAPAADTGVQGFTFGKRDPADKAKRLARVLVSDMIMYNAERHQNALAAGTLVQDFDEEIEKSWKEFVEQVGEDMANGEGKRFWTEALNDILAKGRHVF